MKSALAARSPVVRELFSIIEESTTARAVAARAGYNERVLSAWRCGHRSPTIAPLEDVAQALGYRLKLERIEEKG